MAYNIYIYSVFIPFPSKPCHLPWKWLNLTQQVIRMRCITRQTYMDHGLGCPQSSGYPAATIANVTSTGDILLRFHRTVYIGQRWEMMGTIQVGNKLKLNVEYSGITEGQKIAKLYFDIFDDDVLSSHWSFREIFFSPWSFCAPISVWKWKWSIPPNTY